MDISSKRTHVAKASVASGHMILRLPPEVHAQLILISHQQRTTVTQLLRKAAIRLASLMGGRRTAPVRAAVDGSVVEFDHPTAAAEFFRVRAEIPKPGLRELPPLDRVRMKLDETRRTILDSIIESGNKGISSWKLAQRMGLEDARDVTPHILAIRHAMRREGIADPKKTLVNRAPSRAARFRWQESE